MDLGATRSRLDAAGAACTDVFYCAGNETTAATITYPSLGFDVLQLPLRAFPYALTSPQLVADHRVGEAHQADRHEVRYDHKRHVVPEIRQNKKK